MNKREGIFLNKINSVRFVVILFGLLCGISGIISGVFEILQGNIPIENVKTSAVGPGYSMYENYTVITIFSNYLITGIVAVISGIMVSIWVLFMIHKKYGIIIFLILSLVQLLSGGGIVIDMALLTSLLATQIKKPLTWWKNHLNDKIKILLVKIWPWSVLLFILLSVFLLVLSVFGVNSSKIQEYIVIIAAALFIPILFSVFGAFAYNIKTIKPK